MGLRVQVQVLGFGVLVFLEPVAVTAFLRKVEVSTTSTSVTARAQS